MTISKQFLSSLFLPQVVAVLLVVSSLSLSAMDLEDKSSSHHQAAQAAENNQVLRLKEDGSAPDGYVFAEPILAKVEALLKEKIRLIDLAIKMLEGVPGMEFRVGLLREERERAQGALGQFADGISEMYDAIAGILEQLSGNISIKVIKQELAAEIQQEMDEVLLNASNDIRGEATALGRFDVIAELENREMTQEDINAMRWHKAKKC